MSIIFECRLDHLFVLVPKKQSMFGVSQRKIDWFSCFGKITLEFELPRAVPRGSVILYLILMAQSMLQSERLVHGAHIRSPEMYTNFAWPSCTLQVNFCAKRRLLPENLAHDTPFKYLAKRHTEIYLKKIM